MYLLHPRKDKAIKRDHQYLVVMQTCSASKAWRIVESQHDEASANDRAKYLQEQNKEKVGLAKAGHKAEPVEPAEYKVCPMSEYLPSRA